MLNSYWTFRISFVFKIFTTYFLTDGTIFFFDHLLPHNKVFVIKSWHEKKFFLHLHTLLRVTSFYLAPAPAPIPSPSPWKVWPPSPGVSDQLWLLFISQRLCSLNTLHCELCGMKATHFAYVKKHMYRAHTGQLKEMES